MKKLTIVDIAKMAGVGTTTVSRYFNGGNLKKETRERIKEIVDKYNYTPNTFAKALKSTDSKIIGVIVPCLHSYISGNTLKYLDKELKENNYETLIMNANFDENKQLEYIKKLARINVDGIILLPTTMSKAYESTIKSIDVPVVMLGQEGEYTYSVEYNDFNAARDLTNYVLASGHKKIAYLGVGEDDIAVGYYRKLGVLRALEKYNLEPENILITNFGMEEGYEIVKENIEKLKEDSCLICATDNLAYGAIKALEEEGLNVGEDYSVAAFGDYTSSALLKSPLTTIKFDLKDAAKQTVEMLLNVIKKEETAMKLLIGYELKIRDSVVDLNKMENKND
jgi:sucrose operon repressor